MLLTPSRFALAALLIVSLAPLLEAQETESRRGQGQIGLRVGYYNTDDSGDGNPFYDESLTVIEPVVFFSYYATHSTNIHGSVSYDAVTSASIARLDDYEFTGATGSTYIAQSGASGDEYIGVNLGVLHHWSDALTTDTFGSFSKEYDYKSIGLGGSISSDVAESNATITGSLQLFYDELDIIRFTGNEEGIDHRTSLATTLRWYQILTPEVHGTLGVTLGFQEGFLATPYNGVVIEDSLLPPNPHLDNQANGLETTEVLPGTRTRVTAFGRYRVSLVSWLAGELEGRLYTDTWGIDSVTISPRIFYWPIPDRLRLRLGYRFYSQTPADAYNEHFFAPERYRTQDSDLGDFTSHTVGLQLRYAISARERVDIGGDFIFRSDYLDQFVASIGWSHDF